MVARDVSDGSPNVDQPQDCGSAMMGLKLAAVCRTVNRFCLVSGSEDQSDLSSKLLSLTAVVTVLRVVIPNVLLDAVGTTRLQPGICWGYFAGWKE